MSEKPKHPEEFLQELSKVFRNLLGPICYRLEGHTPVPCDVSDDRRWARVRHTQVGPYIVSTIFMGIDYRHWGDGPPVLFETITFLGGEAADNPADSRCCTWEEAEEMHQEAINWIMANDWQPSDTVRELPLDTPLGEG